MGLNEFSMAASEIASTRYQIRHLNYEHCQALADEICKKSTIAEVREMLEKQ